MRRVLFLLLWAVMTAGAEERPNILLIIGDSVGIHDLSCYGRQDHATPALDRLAAQGTRYTSAYAAAPERAPSLAALLTGLQPARLRFTAPVPPRAAKPSQRLLEPRTASDLPPTLATMLKSVGYATAWIGPWRLTESAPAGFDSFSPGATLNEIAKAALAFLGTPREQPYFVVIAPESPYLRMETPAESPTKLRTQFNATYSATITALDELVAQLLQRVDEHKTLVIFTSSNGGLHVPQGQSPPATDNGSWRAGKGYLYEGGVRVPLIIRGPGFAKPTVEEAPAAAADLMPTLLKLAGVKSDAELDFQNLATTATVPRPFAWHFPHYSDEGGRPTGALRISDWKLLEHYEDGSAELFDLAHDPGEQTDVSTREAKRTAEMRGQLAAWRQSLAAQENFPNPAFDLSWHGEVYDTIDTSNLPKARTADAVRRPLAAWLEALNRPAEPARSASAPGYILLPASEAIVSGQALRYEPEPHKNTLGFWKYASDTAKWTITVPVGGRYVVDALVGCGTGCGGAEVEVQCGTQKPSFTVAETGHFQNFVPQRVGTLRLAEGPNEITVVPRTKPGPAVMDLRQLMLMRVAD